MRIPLEWEPPKREDYTKTVEKLTDAWSGIVSVYSIMLYGSVARGKYVPGRSDLDMALVFDADVITEKSQLIKAASVIKDVTAQHRVELQLSVYDVTTLRDVRFCTSDRYFRQHLNEEGKLLFGKDFRKEAPSRTHCHTKENTLGMRLRHNRVRFLEALFHAVHNPSQFSYEVGSCMEKACEVALESAEYVTGSAKDYSKGGALEYFEETFPNINTNQIRKIASILDDFEKFDQVRRSPHLAIPTWIDALTFSESVIKELVHNTKGPAPTTFADA